MTSQRDTEEEDPEEVEEVTEETPDRHVVDQIAANTMNSRQIARGSLVLRHPDEA
jgi:hypothetical protein